MRIALAVLLMSLMTTFAFADHCTTVEFIEEGQSLGVILDCDIRGKLIRLRMPIYGGTDDTAELRATIQNKITDLQVRSDAELDRLVTDKASIDARTQVRKDRIAAVKVSKTALAGEVGQRVDPR